VACGHAARSFTLAHTADNGLGQCSGMTPEAALTRRPKGLRLWYIDPAPRNRSGLLLGSVN
jgi:hypothetical protein